LGDVALGAIAGRAVFVRRRRKLDVTGTAEGMEERFGGVRKITAVGAVAVEAPAGDTGVIREVVMASNAIDRRVFIVW